MVAKKQFTPRKVAKAIGVSESSLKRWCDRGLIQASKTVGGHRRIPLASIAQFVKTSGYELVDPEALGFAKNELPAVNSLESTVQNLRQRLSSGDEEGCRQILFELFLGPEKLAEICDHVISPAFRQIGELWECGRLEVFEERRACEIAARLMIELRSFLEPIKVNAPLALGGTLVNDPYALPTTMVEIVLRSNGWNAQSLGMGLPFETLLSAIREHQPRLFWLSVSSIGDRDQFIGAFREFRLSMPSQTALVVGGRALDESIRKQMEYSAYCDTMSHLESFAETIFEKTHNQYAHFVK